MQKRLLASRGTKKVLFLISLSLGYVGSGTNGTAWLKPFSFAFGWMFCFHPRFAVLPPSLRTLQIYGYARGVHLFPSGLQKSGMTL
ncbi:hypothetical protein FN846DRAFT_947045 [Sphaerosporella brunnea]|uniref:Uncharacterized protein n=1 Tax=Sphaerosporella brunnea TaxID=1250544 RepID=A0A5J5EYF2_9PEZI|nr:hypothetical protein FN846DRAFT_947045 [Sphaerosporella brunnea]